MAEKEVRDMTEPEIRDMMRAVAVAVDERLREATGKVGMPGPKFVVIVFDDPKVAQFISSCNREDVVRAMIETAARLSTGEGVVDCD